MVLLNVENTGTILADVGVSIDDFLVVGMTTNKERSQKKLILVKLQCWGARQSGEKTWSQRHPGQDLVPEQKVAQEHWNQKRPQVPL